MGDPLLESLLYIAKSKEIHCSRSSLIAGLPLVNGRLSPELYLRAAERAGMKASVVQRSLADISPLVLPVVLLLENDNAAILLDTDNGKGECHVFLPLSSETRCLSLNELEQQYTGLCLFTAVAAKFEKRIDVPKNIDESDWFWGVFKQSWRIYRDVLLASLLINIFVIANPLFVMNVYDRVVPNSALETLWALALGVLVLYSFDFVLKLLRTYFLELAGKKSDVILSSLIMEKVLGARFEYHPKSVGAFTSQLRDFETVRSFITSATITTLIDMPFVVFFLIVIAYLGGIVVLAPLIAIPCILLFSWYLHKKLSRFVSLSFAASAQKNATLVEAVTNLETVKALGGEGGILRKWELSVGQLALWGLKSRNLSLSAATFANFIQQVANVFVVVLGVYAISQNNLTQGALIACVILTGRALSPLAQLSGLLVQYHQAKLALDTLEVMVKKPQERDSDSKFIQGPVISGKLEFRCVDFSYPDEDVISLSNVSFKVSAGERVAIIGRIGSGKSTINKLLLALYRSNSGNVLVDDLDISQIDPADLRASIGYVPQDATLFYGTIRENILRSSAQNDMEMRRVSDIAGVTDIANSHPKGFERNVGERGEFLSGGQRQSISVARALIGKPPILLMDEPTTAMDNTTEARFIEKLKPEIEGRTLLMVTHKLSLLSLVDRVIVIDKGKILADGEKSKVIEAIQKGQLNVS